MLNCESMKTDIQRINNVIGQLEGVKKMIEEEKPCFEVLVQLKAIKSAVRSVSTQYLSSQFSGCIADCNAEEQEATCAKFMKELLDF